MVDDFQTILPFVMMYSPVGLLIVLPLFEVYVGSIANFVGASLAVYPSLEPLIAMFCIKEFRKTVTCGYSLPNTQLIEHVLGPSLRKVTPATVSYTTSSRAV